MKQTAVYLGLPIRSVWRLQAAGLLHAVRWPGFRAITFDRTSVEALFGEGYKA